MAWTDTLNDMQYPILRWSDVDVPLWLNLRDMIREFISSVCSKNSHAMQPRDTCQNTMSQWHYVVTRLWFFEHPVYPFRAFETSYRLYPSWWFRRFRSLSSSACLGSTEDYTGFRWKTTVYTNWTSIRTKRTSRLQVHTIWLSEFTWIWLQLFWFRFDLQWRLLRKKSVGHSIKVIEGSQTVRHSRILEVASSCWKCTRHMFQEEFPFNINQTVKWK